MAEQQPQKNEKASSSGGGGKRNNRRYFRRRRKGSGSGSGGDGSQSQEKAQGASQPDAKSQAARSTDQPSEQQEKRRKRRRSNNNRRSSSSRRQRRNEQAQVLPPVAPEPERYQEPIDVFVHTHIVRPAYRDAGSDHVSETSFLSGLRQPEISTHIERLQTEINGHLDEYFNRSTAPAKVTREAGDEDWDDEE